MSNGKYDKRSKSTLKYDGEVTPIPHAPVVIKKSVTKRAPKPTKETMSGLGDMMKVKNDEWRNLYAKSENNNVTRWGIFRSLTEGIFTEHPEKVTGIGLWPAYDSFEVTFISADEQYILAVRKFKQESKLSGMQDSQNYGIQMMKKRAKGMYKTIVSVSGHSNGKAFETVQGKFDKVAAKDIEMFENVMGHLLENGAKQL